MHTSQNILKYKLINFFRLSGKSQNLIFLYIKLTVSNVDELGLFDRAFSSWNNLKCQLDAINFIDVFLARHVSGTYAHH